MFQSILSGLSCLSDQRFKGPSLRSPLLNPCKSRRRFRLSANAGFRPPSPATLPGWGIPVAGLRPPCPIGLPSNRIVVAGLVSQSLGARIEKREIGSIGLTALGSALGSVGSIGVGSFVHGASKSRGNFFQY